MTTYHDGTDILAALLGVEAESIQDVTRAVLVMRAGDLPQLHVWHEVLDLHVPEVRLVRDRYELLAKEP